MNDDQKKIFVNGVYEKLEEKPDYQEYLLDNQLAVLNKYVELLKRERMKITGIRNMQLQWQKNYCSNQMINYVS